MEGPPAGTDLSATQVPRILGVNIATFCLAVIAIVLRVTARRLTRAAFWWDDWLMLPAIMFSALMCFVSITYMVDHGLGRHIWTAPMDSDVVWAKGLFISEISYTIIICSIKFSLLAFYWRIFKQSKIRIPIYVLGFIILITILQCQPVSDFWNRFSRTAEGPFHCAVNVNQFFCGNSIPNIVTDAALLVLPIPFIWQLHLPRAQKLGLTSIFILGIFVIGVSIARFTVIINLDLASPDVTWNFVNTQIWTGVESHVGIICVSHQLGRDKNTSETTDEESNHEFALLSEQGRKAGTYIGATNVALDDMRGDQGIQVRTDVYVGEYGRR
ncbi:MAG: hypothetical protein Q9224_001689 [Gallowayella concinna]